MSWDPEWQVDKRIGPQETLLRYFGDALRNFLKLQVELKTAKMPVSEQEHPGKLEPKLLLTKSPSVKNLNNFFKLFPDDYLLIIVRDGRAVLESGVRSFDWNYEKGMRDWAAAAKIIINFQKKYRNSGKKFLIVKYEDLYKNTKDELLKIFTFLGLDAKLYNFEDAQSLSVTGSSDVRKSGSEKMHWKPVEKTSQFNPLERFSNWNRGRHERFNWIAGCYMREFGYSLQACSLPRYLYFVWNTLLDLKWGILVVLKLAKRKAVRVAYVTRRAIT